MDESNSWAMVTEMIKKTLLLALLASCCFASEVFQVKRSYHKSRFTPPYGPAKYYELKNEENRYLVYFQWIHADAKHASAVVIGLPEPVFHDGWRNRDFLRLNVNGISSRQVEPRNIRIEEQKLLIDYNFDGCLFTLEFFMDDNSPLLKLRLRRQSGGKEPKQLSIEFTANPSRAGGKTTDFAREIISDTRSISKLGKRGYLPLTPQDRNFVLADRFYDNSDADRRSQGPCFLQVDWQNITEGKVFLGQINNVAFTFSLLPDAYEWNFAFLEIKRKCSNKDFLQYLQQKEIFANP